MTSLPVHPKGQAIKPKGDSTVLLDRPVTTGAPAVHSLAPVFILILIFPFLSHLFGLPSLRGGDYEKKDSVSR